MKWSLHLTLENTSKTQTYLGADTCCGHTEGQDGDILGSVQPVYSQFGTCGPLHHSHIVFAVIYTKNKQQCLLAERLYPITELDRIFQRFSQNSNAHHSPLYSHQLGVHLLNILVNLMILSARDVLYNISVPYWLQAGIFCSFPPFLNLDYLWHHLMLS